MQIDDYYKNLNNIAVSVQQSLQLDEILHSALDDLLPIFNIPAAEILIYEPDAHLLTIKAHRGLSPDMVGVGVIQMGEGLAGQIAKNNTPLFIDALDSKCGIPFKIIKKENLVSYAGIPLVQKRKLVGVLGLYTRVARTFKTEEQQLLLETGEILGQAIYNSLIYEEAALRAQRFIAVSRAITVTQKIDHLNTVLENLAKVVVQSLGFDGAWIGMVNDEAKLIEGRAGFGIGLKTKSLGLKYSMTARSKNPVGRTLILQEPLIFHFTEDVSDEPYKKWLNSLKVQSVAFVPIISGKQALGVMAAFFCHDQSIDEGTIKALVSIAEQTTIAIENSRLYEETKQSEVRYRNLFESAGPSLAIIDQRQCFQLVNCAFEKLCGYKRKDLIGKRTLDLFLKSENRKVKFSNSAKTGHFETEFVNRDGHTLQIHMSSTAIPGTQQTLVSLIDMTNQRELERRLYRSEELAAIGELSAGIAHEIRNPLVALKTSVGLLQDESQLSDEGQQLLCVVKEETDQMAAIIEDFLQFARPRPPSFEEVEINQVIRDVVKRYKEVNNNKKVKWVENLNDDLPKLWLDRYQIQQVFTNLVLNSLDAMESGGTLQVSSNKRTDVDSSDQIQIVVSDTGIGIHSDHLKKIFQPFYSTKEKGTGMGLAICRRIIDQHGGDIQVESESGKGTSFSVILPIFEKKSS
ncbi:GAF domain-containing protein [bacterium]|nr:GAF domain-containing protein [bacterium]